MWVRAMVPLIYPSVLLAGFLASGSCLICETCISPGEHCSGLPHPCRPHEDACLTVLGMNSLSGESTETLKTCIAATDCYASYISITTNAGLHVESASSCCQYDLCNHWDLNLPPKNVTPNGLECPVCFIFGSGHCEETEFLKCIGLASHCITVSGTLNAGGPPSKFSAKGCSTKTACSLPLQTGLYSAGVIFNLDHVECSLRQNVSSG